MWNSYWGQLERVRTLLDMSMVSIHDRDAVCWLSMVKAFPLLTHLVDFLTCIEARTSYAHSLECCSSQDSRTMLHYALISKINSNEFGNLDATIDFLHSCEDLLDVAWYFCASSHPSCLHAPISHLTSDIHFQFPRAGYLQTIACGHRLQGNECLWLSLCFGRCESEVD